MSSPLVNANSHPITFKNLAENGAISLQNAGYYGIWLEEMRVSADTAYAQQEYHLARRLWLAMAGQGDPEAAFRLGMLHDMHREQKQNSTRAVYWYRRAAQAGHLHAQHNLAAAYANGDGVPADMQQAIHWWQRAARRGNRDSQYNLGIVYATGTRGIDKDIELAKYWWRRAALRGDPQAQFNLGTLYANTDGKSGRYCEAIRWWEESAKNGIQQASRALRIIRTRGDFVACH